MSAVPAGDVRVPRPLRRGRAAGVRLPHEARRRPERGRGPDLGDVHGRRRRAAARHRGAERRMVRDRRPQQARRPLAAPGAGGAQPPARLRRGRHRGRSRGTSSSTSVVAHDVLGRARAATATRADAALSRRPARWCRSRTSSVARCTRPRHCSCGPASRSGASTRKGATRDDRSVPRAAVPRRRARTRRPTFRRALRDRLAAALDDTEEPTMSFIPARLSTITPYLTCRDAARRHRLVPGGVRRRARRRDLPDERHRRPRRPRRAAHRGVDDLPLRRVARGWRVRAGDDGALDHRLRALRARRRPHLRPRGGARRDGGCGPVADQFHGARGGLAARPVRPPLEHRDRAARPSRRGPPPGRPFRAEDLFDEIGYYVLGRPDLDRAKAFYGSVFGWRFAEENTTPGGHRGAHVTRSKVPFGLTEDPGIRDVHPWIRVTDLAATLDRIRAAGGEVVEEQAYACGGERALPRRPGRRVRPVPAERRVLNPRVRLAAMPPVEPPPTMWDLPDPEVAGDGEIAAIGADLEPGTLLAAYRRGLFPMRVGPPAHARVVVARSAGGHPARRCAREPVAPAQRRALRDPHATPRSRR